MREKVKSAIENVVVSTPTFHSVSFQPTYINFFYGKNGTGKTSIAGMFRKPDDLDWLDGENQGDYEIRIMTVFSFRIIFNNMAICPAYSLSANRMPRRKPR